MDAPSSAAREVILDRVRHALQQPAPPPFQHGPQSAPHPHPGSQNCTSEQARPWLPPGGETLPEQLERFAIASQELKTEFHRISSPNQVQQALLDLATSNHWKRIAAHHHPRVDHALQTLRLPCLWTDNGYDRNELEACDASVTSCDALIAQTGSVLVTSRSTGGRALTVLPPHHVVIATQSQMVPDLTAAFQRVQTLHAPNYPSMISLITGPSRTGDIERILVLGAHGPKRLTVLCLQD